jgi:hypothetical protein
LHGDRYIHVEDEVREDHSQRAHAKRPGDVRAALLPSLAGKLLKEEASDWKWMLYADDVGAA